MGAYFVIPVGVEPDPAYDFESLTADGPLFSKTFIQLTYQDGQYVVVTEEDWTPTPTELKALQLLLMMGPGYFQWGGTPPLIPTIYPNLMQPAAHADSHYVSGSDPVTITKAQVQGLVTTLASLDARITALGG